MGRETVKAPKAACRYHEVLERERMRLEGLDYRRVNEAVALMYRRAFTIGAPAAIAETLVHAIGGVNAVAGLPPRPEGRGFCCH